MKVVNAVENAFVGPEGGEDYQAPRKRYGRRKPGEVAKGPTTATGGPVPQQASVPQRIFNAINPFPSRNGDNGGPAPNIPGNQGPANLFTITERNRPSSNWGWRRSRSLPAEPFPEEGPSGTVVIEIGHLVRDARDPRSERYQQRVKESQETHNLLTQAIEVNQETLAAISRTERVLNVTAAVGEKSAEQLAKQSETLHQVKGTLDSMDSQFDRAKTEMVYIVRNLMRNRLFMCLCITVTIGLVAMIVTIIMTETKKPGTPAPGTTIVIVTPAGPTPAPS
jgi:hypothetical protein